MPLTKVASSMLASGASGSGGSAGKNYISSYNGNPCNGDFETGSISGWSVFSVSSITNGLPSGVPTTIAAGGSNPDITLVSPGSQLAGQYSLQASFPISTSANKGFITEVFTIDAQDRAQVLTFGFHYQLTSSASNVNFSGTSSNTFIVSVYAVNGSNAGWIQPAGVYSMTQSSGAGFATGTFQTYSDTTQYRFAILCFNNPTTTSATVTFDDFSVGPTVVVNGTPVTDWQTYTPTVVGMTVSSTSYCQWRRVGDSIQIEARFSNNAVSGSPLSVSLPFNYAIDTNKIAVNGVVGHASAQVGVGSVLRFNVLGTGAGTTLTFGTNLSNNNGNALLAATDNLSFFAQVPITGFSSNVQVSNDTDTRVAAFSYRLSANYSYTSGANIYCDSLLMDTHGAYIVGNTTSGSSYIVPVSGIWKFKNSSDISGTGGYFATIKKNNIVYGETGWITDAGFYEWLVPCNAGDVITIQAGASASIGSSYTSFSGFRLSGPSVVAASETVAASYSASTSASSSTTQAINFDLKEYDTHNAVTPGVNWRYTAPVSGTYLVTIYTNATAGTASYFNIYKNSTSTIYKSIGYASTTTVGSGATSLKLNAGDYIGIYTSASFPYFGNASLNTQNTSHITIIRTGN
jgi:hypothetical protein